MNNVTVLIPAYNHGPVLVYQLESLLAQTSPPERIVVVDDCSTDATPELLKRFQANNTITVIRLAKNGGVHAAMNLLMDKVSTELFAFAAADDLLTRDWCLTMSSLLMKHPDAKMAISNSFIWEDGQVSATDSIGGIRGESEGVFQPDEFVRQLTRGGRLPPSNPIMYRSDIIEDLIRPVASRRDLLNLTDAMTTLSVATKYPVAYSTKCLGIWIKHHEGYSNSHYKKDQLPIALKNIELFSVRDGYIRYREVTEFLKRMVRYTWAKQEAMSELAKHRRTGGGIPFVLRSVPWYAKLLVSFAVNQRYRFLRFRMLQRSTAATDLAAAIDASVYQRLPSA